jgi:DNA-binding MurR/RpiR family transcriptional regulator
MSTSIPCVVHCEAEYGRSEKSVLPKGFITGLDRNGGSSESSGAMKTQTTNGFDNRPQAGLAELVGRLSLKRQEIIRPVMESPREFVLLSVRGLAKRLNTDPATTVRIVRAMGFPGYREFQKFLHDLSIAHATSLDTMRASSVRDADIPAYVRASLEQESRNLQALRNSLEYKRVEALARRIYGARRILILAGDMAACLVTYFEYHLTILGFTVLTATTAGRTAHASRHMSHGDLVFAMSFGRGLRQTVEGLQQARSRGAYCVGMTDTFLSPIARFADECFLASVQTPSFGSSYVAPIALINVILVACANYRRGRTFKLLKEAETEQRLGFRWYEPETGAQ